MMNPAVTCPGESQVNIGETSTVLKDNRGMLMLSDYDEIMCVCVFYNDSVNDDDDDDDDI